MSDNEVEAVVERSLLFDLLGKLGRALVALIKKKERKESQDSKQKLKQQERERERPARNEEGDLHGI